MCVLGGSVGVGAGGAGQGKFFVAYCVWKQDLEESDAVVLFVLPELFSHCGRFPAPEIGSLYWSGSFCPLKCKYLRIIFCNSLMLE